MVAKPRALHYIPYIKRCMRHSHTIAFTLPKLMDTLNLCACFTLLLLHQLQTVCICKQIKASCIVRFDIKLLQTMNLLTY